MSVNQSYTKFCLLSYGIKIYLKQKTATKKNKNNTTTKTQPYTATFPFQLSCSCGSSEKGLRVALRNELPPKWKWNSHSTQTQEVKSSSPYATELELARRLEDDVLLRNPTAPNKNRGGVFQRKEEKKNRGFSQFTPNGFSSSFYLCTDKPTNKAKTEQLRRIARLPPRAPREPSPLLLLRLAPKKPPPTPTKPSQRLHSLRRENAKICDRLSTNICRTTMYR